MAGGARSQSPRTKRVGLIGGSGNYRASALLQKRLDRYVDIAADLAQQHRTDITPGMKRNRCCTTVWVPIKAVRSLSRPALESECEQYAFDLGGGEHRDAGAHWSPDR